MKTHNKLVRDKIPEIIAANGEQAIVHTLGDEEYLVELVKKLGEEYDEFKAARNLEELADIQEVVLALADVLASRDKLDSIRTEKAVKRGTFKRRCFLEETRMADDLRQMTIDTYNTSAAELAAYFAGIGARTDDIDRAFELAGGPQDANVLELGCGDGRDAKEICRRTSHYLGMDISSELIKIAKRQVPEGRFEVADAATCELPPNLDIIFAFASLLHLNKPELQALFERAAKALRPGGIFFISCKYRPEYAGEVNEDKYGRRLFYFYNTELMVGLAGDDYEAVYTPEPEIHGDTDWFQMALKRR